MIRVMKPTLFFVFVLTLCVASCGEPESRVVLEISADFEPTQELDQLEITVAAGTAEASEIICNPHLEVFSLESGSATGVSLPLSIEIKPGAIFNKVLYVRVVGRFWGTVRIKTERMVSLTGGDVIQTFSLERDCLGQGTGRGMHCVNGQAMASPYWRIFDEGYHVFPEQACFEP